MSTPKQPAPGKDWDDEASLSPPHVVSVGKAWWVMAPGSQTTCPGWREPQHYKAGHSHCSCFLQAPPTATSNKGSALKSFPSAVFPTFSPKRRFLEKTLGRGALAKVAGCGFGEVTCTEEGKMILGLGWGALPSLRGHLPF